MIRQARAFPLGIMQGRLSPPRDGRIQSFPQLSWQREFSHAAELGLSSIEWIFESPLATNPLSTDSGRTELRAVMDDTGVRVDYVCADYFMEVPFVRMKPADLENNQAILNRLLEQAALIGAKGVEIPFVDASAITSATEEDELCSALGPAFDLADKLSLAIGLETSLNPERFRALLKRIDHPACKANYDSGNSSSLGYNPEEEFEAYGAWINNVHLKDRILGGTTVPLGTGNANIPWVLQLLRDKNYRGGLVLQAARATTQDVNPEMAELEAVQGYINQIDHWLSELH